jgi:hypothetical protein
VQTFCKILTAGGKQEMGYGDGYDHADTLARFPNFQGWKNVLQYIAQRFGRGEDSV